MASTAVIVDVVGYTLWMSAPVVSFFFGWTLLASAAGSVAASLGVESSDKANKRKGHFLQVIRGDAWYLADWTLPLTFLLSLLAAGAANPVGMWYVWRAQDVTNDHWLAAIGLGICTNALAFMWPCVMLRWRSLLGGAILGWAALGAGVVTNVFQWLLWANGASGAYPVAAPIVYLLAVVWSGVLAAQATALCARNWGWEMAPNEVKMQTPLKPDVFSRPVGSLRL
jgi:hypothetical protein